MKSLSIALVWFYVKNVLTLDCFWSTECKYNYFGSKTPYEIVRGDIRDSIVKSKGCEAISLWAMVRHGKRHPSPKYGQDIREILKYEDFIVSSYKMGNSSLCAQDIENIQNWNIDSAMMDNPFELSSEGYQELLGIGSRIKKTFPELVKEFQETDYLFLSASSHRMKDSARAFANGINNFTLDLNKINKDYQIVAPYSRCSNYLRDVKLNPNIHKQEGEYKKTAEYLNMKKRVERKLGLNFTFSDGNFSAIYDLCRYTWNGIINTPSPWCAVFSEEDLLVLEYVDDIRHYYRNSYGPTQYSKQLGQIPLADLLRNFQLAKTGQGRKIVAYFSSATMTDMMLVALNAYKDKNPLVGAIRDVNRKWRTSLLSTFATNMIAVLNRCNKHGEEDYNVTLYWNEKPMLELCNAGVCSWQQFENIFKPFLNATMDICDNKKMKR